MLYGNIQYEPKPITRIASVTKTIKKEIVRHSAHSKYIHPATHPASIIVESSSKKFVSDLEKSSWDNKVNDNDSRLTNAREPLTHEHAYEPINENIQSHVTSVHAPVGAQANADITKEEIESKLIGEISSHTHAGGSGGLTQSQILNLTL